MKVVQLIYSLSSGGAERFVVDMSNELVAQGHEVHLIIFRNQPGSEFYKFLLNEDIRFHNLNMKPGFGLFKMLRLVKLINQINPDVVHSHLNVIPYIYFNSLFNKRTKFVHTLHNVANHTVGGKFQKVINRFFYKYKKIIPVAISNICNDSFKEFYGLPSANIVHNGRSKIVPTCLYEHASSEIASYLNGENKPVFIHVARSHPSKNHDLLIDAFNRLDSKGISFLLIIIGNGYDEDSARPLRNKSCNSIKYLGEKTNVGDYLLLADAFCLTSHYEGLPISVLEALSAGCIPICTAVGGIPDVITDGITGYLSLANDVDAYCDTVMNYLNHPDAISKNHIQMYFNNNYSISKCVESYLKIYLQH